MTRSDPTVADLVQTFCAAVVAQDDFSARGQVRKGNRYADVYKRAAWELKQLPGGREALERLMEDQLPMVRVVAAANLVRSIDDPAAQVLAAALSEGGLPGLVAGVVLLQLDDGTLDPDAEPPPARPPRKRRRG